MSWYHAAMCGFRMTHKPTGESVTMWLGYLRRPRREDFEAAKRWLWSLVMHAPEPANPVRSYHLNPQLGIEPFIKQEGRPRITGKDRVEAVLGGEFLPSELWLVAPKHPDASGPGSTDLL